MKKLKLGIIAEELFQFSLITYLILLLAETVKEGFVSFFFDLNYLLFVVLISGILMAFFAPEKKEQTPKRLGERDIYWIVIFSLGGGILVYYKTQEIGGLSILIAIITTVIIFLLPLLLYTDEKTAQKE